MRLAGRRITDPETENFVGFTWKRDTIVEEERRDGRDVGWESLAKRLHTAEEGPDRFSAPESPWPARERRQEA